MEHDPERVAKDRQGKQAEEARLKSIQIPGLTCAWQCGV